MRMKLRYWCIMLLSAFIVSACSEGELEGDLYPVLPDGEGHGSYGKVIDGLMESMVRIPGGTFLMGNESYGAGDDEVPTHLVTLSSFYISKYEVTQQLWGEVMGNNPSSVKFNGESYSYMYDFPVTNVSYTDCQEFIRKLNQKTGKKFALPTEAQWELAARGKYARNYSYEDNNVSGKKGPDGYLVIVSEYGFNPNAWGLYQMGGNVLEWCEDWYGAYSAKSQQDPTGPTTGKYRLFRGGSFASPYDECNATYRSGNIPSTKGDNLGLRLVMKGMIDLQVSQEKLNFKRSGGTEKITVITKNSWSYKSSEKWCRVSKSSSELTVVVEENRGKTRNAVITVTAGEDVMEIPVSQDGETFEILFKNEVIDTLKATHMGGEATLTVRSSSSVGWTVASKDNTWCHAVKSGSSIDLTVDEYTSSYYDRETYVLLSSSDKQMTDTLWIKQRKVINLKLYLDGDSDPLYSLKAGKAGGHAKIRVNTNANSFTAIPGNDSWCHVSEKIENSFEISVDALSQGMSSRATHIAVDAEGIKDTIWITQAREQVGDMYDQGGVKGIIYEVSSDGKSGKIVSLQEGSMYWSYKYSSSDRTSATDWYNGENNMQRIRNISGWSSNYPAFYWCNNYSGGGWYLPAKEELKELFSAVSSYGGPKFDKVMTDNGGQEFSSSSDYWSSTETDYEWAYTVNKAGTERHNVKKNGSFRVRAIRKVTF